jgi:hypothetical protein
MIEAMRLETMLATRPSHDVSEMLKAWYAVERLTRVDAAEILGLAPRLLRDWEFGIPMPWPLLLQTRIWSHRLKLAERRAS